MNHQHQEHNSVPNFWSTRYAIGLIRAGWYGSLFSINDTFSHVIGVCLIYSF